jgi:hypothetical protein
MLSPVPEPPIIIITDTDTGVETCWDGFDEEERLAAKVRRVLRVVNPDED